MMNGIKLPYSPMDMRQMANPYAGQTFAQYYQPIQNMAMQTEKMDMLRADRANEQRASRAKMMEEQAYKQELSKAIGQDVSGLTMDEIKARVLPVMAKMRPEKALELGMKTPKQRDEVLRISAQMNTLRNQQRARIDRGVDVESKEYKDTETLIGLMQDELAGAEPSLQNVYAKAAAGGAMPAKDAVEDTTEETMGNVEVKNGIVYRNNRPSVAYTDWVETIEEDGADKPYQVEGSDIRNASERIQTQYEQELDEWAKTNDTARAQAKKAKASKEAKTKGEAIAKKFAQAIPETAKRLRAVSRQINILRNMYNRGEYDLSNFASLKQGMADGRMTDSDVALAVGMDVDEGVLQRMKKWVAGDNVGIGKLNNKENAAETLNLIVDAYNANMKNLLTPSFSGKYAKQAKQAWEDNSYSTAFADLPKSFANVYGNGKPQDKVQPRQTGKRSLKEAFGAK